MLALPLAYQALRTTALLPLDGRLVLHLVLEHSICLLLTMMMTMMWREGMISRLITVVAKSLLPVFEHETGARTRK